MNPGSSSPIPLEDLRWLRALARHLVRDPHLADDAVQDTVVQALTRRPRDAGSLRAWLGAILRNVLRQDWRSRRRRDRLLAAESVERSTPTPSELAEEVALHRRLIEEVHALDEPYRAVVVLRFLHDRKPREIALDLGLTTKAVHTRIERALAKLRARLEPDRRRWLVFLAARREYSGPRKLLAPAFSCAATLVLATLAAKALVAEPRSPEPSTLLSTHEANGSDAPDLAAGALSEGRRPLPFERERFARPPLSSGVAGAARSELVSGSVCTLDGSVVPRIEVRFEREQPTPWGEVYVPEPSCPGACTDARGRFALAVPAEEGRLTVESEEFAAVHRPHLDVTPALEPLVLVVGPRRAYAGRVIDTEGNPVDGVALEIMRGESYLPTLTVGGERLHVLMPLAEQRTDDAGRFRFEAVPFVEGAELVLRRSGFELEMHALPSLSSLALELELQPSVGGRTVRGIVLDEAGMPAAAAAVSAGGDVVRSDRRGRFALTLAAGEECGILRAVRVGSMPAEEALPALSEDLALEDVALRLGSRPLSIRGRVLAESGVPLAGARVWTSDLTPLGSSVYGTAGVWFLLSASVEGWLNGTIHKEEWSLGVLTDEDGRFELGGLLDRSYTLSCLDPRTLAVSEERHTKAGESGVQLHLRRGQHAPLSGRVVSLAGRPLAGVRVVPGLASSENDTERAAWIESAATISDDSGRFSWSDLPVEGLCLYLEGRELLGTEYVAAGQARSRPEIALPTCSRFQLELIDPREADGFALMDARGRAEPLLLEASGHAFGVPRATLDGGCSGLVLTAEGEHHVLLLSGEREVRRVRVWLPAGGPQVLSL